MCFLWELQQPLQAANPQEFGGIFFFFAPKGQSMFGMKAELVFTEKLAGA